jgi:hypothetical protein
MDDSTVSWARCPDCGVALTSIRSYVEHLGPSRPHERRDGGDSGAEFAAIRLAPSLAVAAGSARGQT